MEGSATLVMGPILGFRGLTDDGAWHTSALVVVPADAEEPNLSYAADDEERKAADREKLADLPDCARAYRFHWNVKQTEQQERKVEYDLGGGKSYSYSVPAKGTSPRIAYGSCAGFQNLLDIRAVKGKINAMWEDIKKRHEDGSYHLAVMGGDQVYADGLWDEIPQLSNWLKKTLDGQREEKLSEETLDQLRSYYYRLYRDNWGREEVRCVMARVPTLMMWDDHDIFDGYGSKSEALQDTYVYEGIYKVAREYFRLFQLQAKDDTDLPEGTILGRSNAAGSELKNLTYAYRVGTDVAIALLDMRSQRTRHQVMEDEVWEALYKWMWEKLGDCKHLLVVSTIPLVYFDANFIESTLGAVPGQQNMEDDFRDQWQSRSHLDERLDLIHHLFDLAQEKGCRATIVSGDVHLGAFGNIESEPDGSLSAEERSIVQLISSPIVNKPAPSFVVVAMEHLTALMGIIGRKAEEVDRGIKAEMLQVPGSNQHFISRRNWLSLEMVERGRLRATWFVERDDPGNTVPYNTVPYKKDVFSIKERPAAPSRDGAPSEVAASLGEDGGRSITPEPSSASS